MFWAFLELASYSLVAVEPELQRFEPYDQRKQSRAPYAQASIQDRRLLKKAAETPGVYLRQASIQGRLLFKEIRYVDKGVHVILTALFAHPDCANTLTTLTVTHQLMFHRSMSVCVHVERQYHNSWHLQSTNTYRV